MATGGKQYTRRDTSKNRSIRDHGICGKATSEIHQHTRRSTQRSGSCRKQKIKTTTESATSEVVESVSN